MGLPRELRDEIYRYLLGSRIRIKPAEEGHSVLPTAILQVSRQVSSEAQEIILQENVFIVSSRQFNKHQWAAVLKAPHLKILIFCDYDYWEDEDSADSIYYVVLNFAELFAEHHGLKNLQIDFIFDVTEYPHIRSLKFPDVRNALTAVRIRDSVVPSGQIVEYDSQGSYWDQRRRDRVVEAARDRMEKQFKEQEKCMMEQIAVRKKGEYS